jgi:hypothetical protein
MNRRLHIITAREEKQKIPKEIIGSEYLISPPSEGLLESTLLSSPSLRKYKRAVTISIATATTPNVSPMNSPMRLECPDETEPAWITKKSPSFKIFRTEITPLGKRETAMANTLPCFFSGYKRTS